MHTSRNDALLNSILAGDAMDEHGRTRPPAGSDAFCHASIEDNAVAQGYDNAVAQSNDNATAQGHGKSRPGCVAGRAAAVFTSELTSGEQDSPGVSGDH